jgi:hypothetical protein
MSDPHYPGEELSVIGIFTCLNRLKYFKEGILEDIFSKRLIAYIKTYIGEYFVLMSVD